MRLILRRVMVILFVLICHQAQAEQLYIARQISFPASYYRIWESNPSNYVSTQLDEVYRAKALLMDYISPQSLSLIPFDAMKRAISCHWNRRFANTREFIHMIKVKPYSHIFDLADDIKESVFKNTPPSGGRSSLFQRVRFILYNNMIHYLVQDSSAKTEQLLRFYFTPDELQVQELTGHSIE